MAISLDLKEPQGWLQQGPEVGPRGGPWQTTELSHEVGPSKSHDDSWSLYRAESYKRVSWLSVHWLVCLQCLFDVCVKETDEQMRVARSYSKHNISDNNRSIRKMFGFGNKRNQKWNKVDHAIKSVMHPLSTNFASLHQIYTEDEHRQMFISHSIS